MLLSRGILKSWNHQTFYSTTITVLAAVKRWGHGMEVLKNFAKPPQPSVPVPTPTGPPKTAHDKTLVVQKLRQARSSGGASAGSSKAWAGTGEGWNQRATRRQCGKKSCCSFGETRQQQKNAMLRKLVRTFGAVKGRCAPSFGLTVLYAIDLRL